VPIEIKCAAAVDHHDVRGLRQCMEDLDLPHGDVVIHGPERRTIGTDFDVVSWASVISGEEEFGFASRSSARRIRRVHSQSTSRQPICSPAKATRPHTSSCARPRAIFRRSRPLPAISSANW
jgi:hypothetical protein